MQDIFTQNTIYGGSFKANRASLTFTTGTTDLGGVGLLVQGLQGQYTQQVQRVYEIGPDNRVYFIVGRAMGQLGMNQLIGPFQLTNTFVTGFADPCNTPSNKIRLNTLDGACDTNSGLTGYGFENCLLTTVGVNIEATTMVIRQNLALEFTSMTE